jgi:hypothetical protein
MRQRAVGRARHGSLEPAYPHQERSAPFRLVRAEIPESRAGLVRVAFIRREELDGFVDGLFGIEQSL